MHPVLGTSCWAWGLGHSSGYGKFTFRVNGRDRVVYAHRYAWELINGPIPPHLVVRHRCDNGPCVNPDHLVLGTQRDNIQDSIDRKRFNPCEGEWNPFSKLTDLQVIEIRKRRASGEKLAPLASEFGVSTQTIMGIARGLMWRHVGGPIVPKQVPADYMMRLTTEEITDLCRKYEAGTRASVLAIEFKVSHAHVHALLRRNGIPRRRVGHPSKTTPEQRRNMRAMYRPGLVSMADVAKSFGVGTALVFRVIHTEYLDDC